ncbi:MAG: hypothetical protein VW518_00110 [Burkholderiaceae bacterium]
MTDLERAAKNAMDYLAEQPASVKGVELMQQLSAALEAQDRARDVLMDTSSFRFGLPRFVRLYRFHRELGRGIRVSIRLALK